MHGINQTASFNLTANSCSSEYVLQTCKELAIFCKNGCSEEADVSCIRSLRKITSWLNSNRPTAEVVISVGGRGSAVVQTMSTAAARLRWHVVSAAVQCLQTLVDHLAVDPTAKTGSSSAAVALTEVLQAVTLLLQTHHPFANVGHSEAVYGLLGLARHILGVCSPDSLLPHTLITACRPYMFYGLPAYRSAASTPAEHSTEQALQDEAELLLSSSDHDTSVKSNFTNRNRRKRIRRKKTHLHRYLNPSSSSRASDSSITTYTPVSGSTSGNSSIVIDQKYSLPNEHIPAINSSSLNGPKHAIKSLSNPTTSPNNHNPALQPSTSPRGSRGTIPRNPFASFSPASRGMPSSFRPPDTGEMNATLGFTCAHTALAPASSPQLSQEAETKLPAAAGAWSQDSLNSKSAYRKMLPTKSTAGSVIHAPTSGQSKGDADHLLAGNQEIHAAEANISVGVVASSVDDAERPSADGRISPGDLNTTVLPTRSRSAVPFGSCDVTAVKGLTSGDGDPGAATGFVSKGSVRTARLDGESAETLTSGSEWEEVMEEERGVWSTSRLTSRVRQAALAALSALLTSLGAGGKLRLWVPLLGQAPSLLVCLLGERHSGVRSSALALLCLLLMDSRQHIASATDRADRAAYSSLSQQLGSCIRDVHRVLGQILMTERTTDGLVRTLKAMELLVDNVTYARLAPGLLSTVAATVKPFITHDEAVVRANALSVFVSVLLVKPSVAEVRLLLLRYAAPLGRPSRPPTDEGAWLPLSDDTDQWDEETPDEESANEALDATAETGVAAAYNVEVGHDPNVVHDATTLPASIRKPVLHMVQDPTMEPANAAASEGTRQTTSQTGVLPFAANVSDDVKNQGKLSTDPSTLASAPCSDPVDLQAGNEEAIHFPCVDAHTSVNDDRTAAAGGGGAAAVSDTDLRPAITTPAGNIRPTTTAGRHLSRRRSLLSWLIDTCVDSLLPPASPRGVHVQVWLQSLRLLSACVSEHFCLVYFRLGVVQRIVAAYCCCAGPGQLGAEAADTGVLQKHVFPLLGALVAVLKKECDAALQTDCSVPPHPTPASGTHAPSSSVQELAHQTNVHLRVSSREGSSEGVSSSAQPLCGPQGPRKVITEVSFSPSEWRRLTVNIWLWALQEPLHGLLQLASVDSPHPPALAAPGVVRWHQALTSPTDEGDVARCQVVAAANVITHITTEVTESLPDPLMEALLRCVQWLVEHSQEELSVWGVRVAGSITGHPAVQRAPRAAQLVTAAVSHGTGLLAAPGEPEDSSSWAADVSGARLFSGAVNKTRLMTMSALANLAASLKHYSPSDPEAELLPLPLVETLLKVAICACGDKSKVRPHGVRCLGGAIGWLRDVAYQHQQGCLTPPQKVTWWNVRPELVERALGTLLECCSGGCNMKMRWNACHALGHLLRCPLPIQDSQKWRDPMVTQLCSLIGGFHNYKVRIQACGALCSLPSRTLYTDHYSRAWRALLAAANSSQNVVDYLEILHRDDLICQVVRGMWHLTALVTIRDCEALGSALQDHEDSVRAVVRRAYVCLPPHLWGPHERARQHVLSLVQNLDALTDDQSETLDLLQQLLLDPPPPVEPSADLLADADGCSGARQLH